MAKRMIKQMSRMKGHCMYMGFSMLILGALVLANTYWQLLSWPAFVGWALILAGFLKLTLHKKCM